MAQDADPAKGWTNTGRQRPSWAIAPEAGQESVWDYPRPPAIVDDTREVVVSLGVLEIARSRRSVRVLEPASPPTFYVPWADVTPDVLVPADGASWCEWKGQARYWSLVTDDGRVDEVAWAYPQAHAAFARLRDYVAFYPSRVECFVDGERVQPQPGRFYGGWITREVVGPFKGEPGTGGW